MYISILTPLICFLFLQRITISAATNTSSTAYSPIENIALNCGASENSTAVDGREWFGDSGSAFASSRQANDTSVISKPLHDDVSNIVPFTTARIFPCQYTYTFPVTAGPKFIRLHFYPATYPGFSRSESLFSVKAGPYTLLGDFNASLVADDLGLKYLSKEFCLIVEQNQTLNLTFSPLPATPLAHAFINGIEIVSMPTNLYYTRPGDIGIPFIGQSYQFFYVDNKTALETVYRLNVGGMSISPMDDTGMFRFWRTDDDYVMEMGALPVNLTISFQYTRTPEYIAPIELYKTSRSMGNDKAQNERYNLTWEFPVDSGFMYLVRLHFCEFQPEVTQVGDREFHIFIDDQTAEAQADVIAWAGGNGIPVYKDYVVMMERDAIEGKRNLSIALHPNAEFRTRFPDAILNGLEMFKLNDSYGNLVLQPYPTSKHSTGKETLFLVVGAIIIGVAVVLALSGFTVFRWRKRSKSGTRNTWSPPHKEPLCRHFSLAEIRTATENFSDRFVIGSGGFGKVYKGLIKGGATAVAIKRLTRGSNQGAREFWTEINMLSQLRHTHLVSLIGYCNDHQEMILVYEFMAHGTLADHLYKNREHGNPLPWKQRLEICIGAARGLDYLHAGEQHRIIHRDVKTSNILLDENWVAKIADFGLSKLGTTQSLTHISTDVKGTFGYLDPEYYWTHRLTEKSDVFAFGVVLFESLCGRPAVDMTLEEEEEKQSLCHWAQHCVKAGTLDQIIDPHLMGTITRRCLAVFVDIANKCLLGSRIERPTMTDVVRCLELALTLQESNNAAAAEEAAIDFGGVIRTRSASLPEDTSHRMPIRFFSDNGRVNLSERSIISASYNLCFAVNDSQREVF